MKQKFKIVLAFTIAIAFIVSLLYLSQNSRPAPIPELVTSSPASGAVTASVVEPISLVYNQPVDISTLSFASAPKIAGSMSQPRSDTVVITHAAYLQSNTKYTLNISRGQETITTLSFTTGVGQGDPNFYQQVNAEMDKNYPLAQFTPYENPYFRVVYSAPLALEITLKNTTLTPDQAITQIKSWVQSHGLDPSSHTYSVVAPSPTPTPTPSPAN